MVQTPAKPETETLLLVSYLNVEILSNPAELSGEEVLPGFVLNLGRVWG